MNKYLKYCPNVFVAACECEHSKGDEITLTTKRGKENLHIVHNYLGKTKDGLFCYSITRADGLTCQDRANRKAERLEGFAENAAKRSNEAWRKADLSEDATGIPFGQPILVGHHSERRHRKVIENANRNMGKCVAESDKAKAYQRRAEYWERKANEINLSMPESIDFYEFKLEEATRFHADLKANPEKRAHGMSLQYANNAKKEAEKNLKLAKKLWGDSPVPQEPEKPDVKKNPFDDFDGLFFAFNNQQFAKGMRKIGLSETETDKIVSIGAGGYLLKERIPAFKATMSQSA